MSISATTRRYKAFIKAFLRWLPSVKHIDDELMEKKQTWGFFFIAVLALKSSEGPHLQLWCSEKTWQETVWQEIMDNWSFLRPAPPETI